MAVRYDDNPKITDPVQIVMRTTDAGGAESDPYLVEKVTVYLLVRGYDAPASQEFADIDTAPFEEAVPVYTLGGPGSPAWLSTADPDDQALSHDTADDDGSPQYGAFSFVWQPDTAREGEYVVTWTWRPMIAADTLGSSLSFSLVADPAETASIPTHITPAEKWPTVMQRWLPAHIQSRLSDADVTADVLRRFLDAAGGGFKLLEDFANQMPDLLDANAVSEPLLPYLSNLFSLKLRSGDPSLWRRQVRTAIPTFKKKGTVPGLTDALAAAGVELKSFEMMWQVVSQATWQEAFVSEDGQTEFPLARPAVVDDPIDADNFQVWVRPAGENGYTAVNLSEVDFQSDSLTWLGADLSAGDIVRVVYKISDVADQDSEDYLRSLPLADKRDERGVTYPPKNWNVRLISETDEYFSALCPVRNPFRSRLVYGQVRTEFPYSEKIYNMEEFNGSVRDSYDPCDIDRGFLDDCSAGQSSRYAATVEVHDLTDDRVAEVSDILRDYLPFHAQPHLVNYAGGIEDMVPPPEEEIEILATVGIEDFIVQGDQEFNRAVSVGGNLTRSMLAAASTVTTRTDGHGYNIAQTLFAPTVRFDGLNVDDCILFILSGLNEGEYTVSDPVRNNLDIDDTCPSPSDTALFPFHLSREWWDGNAAVEQADIANFSESGTDLIGYGADAGWAVQILAGPQAGSYAVDSVRPTGELVLSGWPTPTTASSLSFQLRTPAGVSVYDGTAGKVSVVRRGKAYCTTDLYAAGVRPGFYYEVGGSQYRIGSLEGVGYAYLVGYAAGSQAGAAKVWRRDVEDVASLSVRGARLETTVDHYTALSVDDYGKDSFLVLIGSDYYQISSWSNSANGSGRYEIELAGLPLPSWGLTGTTGVSYSIIRFDPESPLYVEELS